MNMKSAPPGKELYIASEIGRLCKVVIHRPDRGIERVTPSKAVELLYEDIVHLRKMREEFDQFKNALSFMIGQEGVLDAEDLLADVLVEPSTKQDLITEVCAIERCDYPTRDCLRELHPLLLANALITGITNNGRTVFPPTPNFIFTRDTTAIIHGWIIVSKAAKLARIRESCLMKYIAYHHPLFRESPKIEITQDDVHFSNARNRKPMDITIEGGDIMMWEPKHVFIGSGERTSLVAFEALRDRLLTDSEIQTVSCIQVPKRRAAMHLDTICTRISRTECVVDEHLVRHYGNTRHLLKITCFERKNGKGNQYSIRRFDSLESLILSITPKMTFIHCGGGIYPYNEREQWTDGCNMLAIQDGIIMGYDRNEHTTEELQKHGYKVISAHELSPSALPTKKTIILIPSHELSRARGGPRCMTFPIYREEE